jgi:hypothetical protein
MSKSEKNQPMDSTAREVLIPVEFTNNTRVCWAAKTLVAEVEELFPETPVEYSNYDGRNTALDVAFDLTTLDREDSEMLSTLLIVVRGESRVREVVADYDTQQVLVGFKSDPRTQDSREPFGLGDALLVLDEDVD